MFVVQNHLKNGLRNILSGKSKNRFGTVIQTIVSSLIIGEKANATIASEKHFKNSAYSNIARTS